MTKADWLKLAMPVSITLLGVALLTAPIVATASVDGAEIHAWQKGYWTVRLRE